MGVGVLSLKLKEGIELSRGDKTKKKVWKDANEVVKASSLKDKEKDIFKIMSEIPQGEKGLK